MKETKLARQPIPQTDEGDQSVAHTAELRPLDDLELLLAGGGDTIVTWP